MKVITSKRYKVKTAEIFFRDFVKKRGKGKGFSKFRGVIKRGILAPWEGCDEFI